MKSRSVLFFALAVLLGFILYSLGFILGVSFLTHTSLPLPTLLKNPTPHPLEESFSALAVALGAAVVARGFRGSFLSRWFLLVLFLYVLGHFISAMESAYFTKIGGTGFLMAMGLFPSILGAFGVTLLTRPSGQTEPFFKSAREYFRGRAPREWLWRLALAWLSFPAIYLLFGSMVAPLVKPYYESVDILALPSMGTLVTLQLARSLLILAAILPFFISWKGTRGRLIAVFGWAFYSLTGLNGLLAGTFLPEQIRWVHGVETLADAAAYAVVAAYWLFPVTKGRGSEI